MQLNSAKWTGMSYHRIQQVTIWQQIPEHQNPCWQLLQWSNPVLLDQLTRLTPGDSGTWNTMTSSKRTLEVRPSTSLYSICIDKYYCKSRHTLYCHIQTELNNNKIENSPNLRVSILNSTVHKLPESHQNSLHWSLEVRPKASFSTVWCLHRRTLL